jgi:glutathionylspermidine synthase
MMREEFARNIPKGKTQWIEPAWKVLLSSKSILPLLYERYPDSPFILPASYEPLEVANQVRKPIYGREGANIQVIIDGKVVSETPGPYGQGPFVYQQLAPLKQFDGFYPVIGSWVIDGESAGIGIREEDSIITKNTSRFVPHQLSN